MVQVLHLADDVVLEVQDLQPAAVAAEGIIDRLQFFLPSDRTNGLFDRAASWPTISRRLIIKLRREVAD